MKLLKLPFENTNMSKGEFYERSLEKVRVEILLSYWLMMLKINMKKIITIFIFGLSNLVLSQSEVIEIEYEIELTDPFTGSKSSISDMEVDWQFNVKYDSENVRIWRKFADEFYEERIIAKNKDEVLLLKSEAENKYAFYTSTCEMLIMDRSSNYGDTSILITSERKNVLGYDCYKVIMDFGGQAKATLWLTDSLKIGSVLPATPLSMEVVALEYRLEEPSLISEFKAKYVKRITDTINNTSIPDPYLLIVPVSVFDLTDSSEDDLSQFDFVQYPKYPNGKVQLHSDIRALCSLSKMNEDDLFDYNMAFISFTVKKDGALENIQIKGMSNRTEMQKVLNFLSMSTFTPGIVKGEAVNSSVHFSVSLNE